MTMGNYRPSWLLAIVYAANHIEGITRLQKYAFLAAKRIKGITHLGFYDDWKPSNYGPFSQELASDLNEVIKRDLVTDRPKPNKYGYKISMLEPTKSATSYITELKSRHPRHYEEIRKLVTIYQSKRLIDVLHHVYSLYPEFAIQSKIRAQVGRQIYESDSYLNPEYDESNV
jgi:uncharacterized protein YwgA